MNHDSTEPLIVPTNKNISVKTIALEPTSRKKSNVMEYTPTMMCGRYTRDLGNYAKEEARKLKGLEWQRKSMDQPWNKELNDIHSNGCYHVLGNLWRNTFGRIGDEWMLMVMLGLSTAVISFGMDKGIGFIHSSRVKVFRMVPDHGFLQYATWVSMPVLLIMFGSAFVQAVSPQAIGSGFTEIRAILRGVTIKGYLCFSTLVAKVVGLMVTLGAGMPLGKEGPFVHISSILSELYSKMVSSIGSGPDSESHNIDLLAAAAAVGIGACFASPVGGVLFSIEATASYFAVRNYWRGFLGAVFGTLLYRLLFVWYHSESTITALYETSFLQDIPFCPQELFVFGLFGVLCGIAGALFVWILKVYILWMKSTRIHKYLKKTRLLYPVVISFIIATLQYPNGLGRYTAGELNSHEHFHHLFSNFTWSKSELSPKEAEIVSHWTTPQTSAIMHIFIFLVFSYLFSIISSTMPIPCGMFVPVFKIGAALGRLVGEAMHVWFPSGLPYGAGMLAPIVPGGYAVVGAAAFAGATTHTVSVCAIVFEITGQIKYMGPVIVAALVANIVARKLHQSMYDMLADIKHLPNLPNISPSSESDMYNVFVQDFMIGDVLYIWKGITYRELAVMLETSKKISCLPLVKDPAEPILLGSIERIQLLQLMDKCVGRMARQEEAAKRWLEEQEERNRRPSVYEIFPISNETTDSVDRKENHSKTFNKNSTQELDQAAKSRGIRKLFKKNLSVPESHDDPEVGEVSENKVFMTPDRHFDFLPEARKLWVEQKMSKPIDLHLLQIDPAPVQLVENTTIFKVHRMFSILTIDMAYVTNFGCLVGVVGLKELKAAVEAVNKGSLAMEVLREKHEENLCLMQQSKKSSFLVTTGNENRSKKPSVSGLTVDLPLAYADDVQNDENFNEKQNIHTRIGFASQ
ncbi:chloride channel protein 2-like [Malaya genurostris]|uniref:chloride channel protein 2-like n=1 Tax=Malaya genurostris TaxID=325434 RepID=UPI0026F39532|nr:chloride channel protein 2-like [Malaya genurostris]